MRYTIQYNNRTGSQVTEMTSNIEVIKQKAFGLCELKIEAEIFGNGKLIGGVFEDKRLGFNWKIKVN